MIHKIKSSLARNAINLFGFKTNRKIVVIESDDWGTIRTTSREAYEVLLNKGYPVDKNPYSKFDSLESNQDLERLMEVLASISDKNSHPAILTANNIVANPVFSKIKESNYSEYHFELFPETLKTYPSHDKVMGLYKEGISSKTIQPQFHGREHLNVNRWMRDLKLSKPYLNDAFDVKMFSLHWKDNNEYDNEYMDAFDCDDQEDLAFIQNSIIEGLSIFKSIWGFDSKSTIAPCYIWSNEIEETFKAQNVQYIQGLPIQFEPVFKMGTSYKKRLHYTGQKNKFQQNYLVRNAFFEPSVNPNINYVDDCLSRIELAFKHKTPAIISSHRVNFIGTIFQENSSENLKAFQLLLKSIVKKWPDVEFLSSDQLGDIISKKNN